MSYNFMWIFLLVSHAFAASLPVHHQYGSSGPVQDSNSGLSSLPNYDSKNQQVISVSVTSSVAVGRGKTRTNYRPHPTPPDVSKSIPPVTPWNPIFTTDIPFNDANTQQPTTYAPPPLLGANIEYLKQLNAKKDPRDYDANSGQTFQAKHTYTDNYETSQTDKSYMNNDYIQDLPQARKVPSASNTNMFDDINRFYHNPIPKKPATASAKNFTSLANFDGNLNYNVNNYFSTESYQIDDAAVVAASRKSHEYTKPNTNNGHRTSTYEASRSTQSFDYDQGTNKGRSSPRLTTVNFNIPQTRNLPSPSNAFQDMSGVYRNTNPQFLKKPGTKSDSSDITKDSIFANPMLGFAGSILNVTKKPIYTQELDFGTVTNTNDMTNVYDFFTTETYQTDDSVAEASIKSADYVESNVNVGSVLPTFAAPRSAHSPNYSQGLNKRVNDERDYSRLTTVGFNLQHDTSNVNMGSSNNAGSRGSYRPPSQITTNQHHFSEPAKIYSQPSQIYSEPAKFYSEPSKVYSEPSKIYSEPAKVYGEPSKVYSEPSKFYSEPASLHLDHSVPQHGSTHTPQGHTAQGSYSPWQQTQQPAEKTAINTTPISTITNSYQPASTQMEHQPEKNYEIDEKISVMTDGRTHGVQESNTEKCKQDNCKVGYVVEGRQFKKYRVEERTSDGRFIVGEYGVVRNEDGDLRGVRYTADSDASPGLIHDALMKFLQLK